MKPATKVASRCPFCDGAKHPWHMKCRKCYSRIRKRIQSNLQSACLMYWAMGFTAREIAPRLKLSPKRIQQGITEGQARLRIWGQANITRWALKTGLI